MEKITILLIIIIAFALPFIIPWGNEDNRMVGVQGALGDSVKLPFPRKTGSVSVEEALAKRRSKRDFKKESLPLSSLSQLLWAAQGVNDELGNKRTAPSAGSTYPLETYAVIGAVEGLTLGVYHYNPGKHMLTLTRIGDVRGELAQAALNQGWIRDAPASIVFTADYSRTTGHYGDRGIRYVDMEAGHAAQNVYLQAAALGLGTVVVGAFEDEEVLKVLDSGPKEAPLYILPVGVPD